MTSPEQARRLRFAAACVGLAFAISATGLQAQDAVPPASRADSAVHLLPTGKAVLDTALTFEKRDTPSRSPISFPMPSCGFAGGLCGAVNRDGTLAVAPAYDWIDQFHEDRALIRSGGLYGYVDTTGRVIVKPQYAAAGRFSHGFAQIDVGGKSGVIDREGRTLLKPQFGFVVPFTDTAFWVSEGRTVSEGVPGTEQFALIDDRLLVAGIFLGAPGTRKVAPTGQWQLVDPSGTPLQAPEVAQIEYFAPDHPELMLAKTESGWGVIRPDGSWQIAPRFEALDPMIDGLAAAKIDGHWGFVDASGLIKIEPKFDFVSGFEPAATLTVARANGAFGLIDHSGAWVVDPRYTTIAPIRFFNPTTWWNIASEGKHGLLDETGHLVAAPLFDYAPMRCDDGRIVGMIGAKLRVFTREGKPIEPAEGELWGPPSCELPDVVKVDGKFGYADRALSLITPPRFESAASFLGGESAAASIDGKFGLLKRDGTWAAEPTFQAVSATSTNGIALAEVGGKFGILGLPGGNWVKQPQFDRICLIGSGLIMAFKDGKRGILDKEGHWLIEPNFTRIGTRLSDGLVPATNGGRWGFIDGAGTQIIDAKYDEPMFFDRGIAWARTADSWCPIDRRGKAIDGLRCQSSDPHQRQQVRVFDCRIDK